MCARVSFLIKLQASACNFIKKESGTGLLLWILQNSNKNTLFIQHLQATASVLKFETDRRGIILWKLVSA